MNLRKIVVVGWLVAFCVNLQSVQGANILFYIGFSSYSHQISMWPLIDALAEKGHTVALITPWPKGDKVTKVEYIQPKSLSTWADNEMDGLAKTVISNRGTGFKTWFILHGVGVSVCDLVTNDTDLMTWIKGRKFDLVVVDSMANECGYGFAHYYKAKIISFTTTNMYPWYGDSVGYPDESSWLPDQVSPESISSLTFLQRAASLLQPLKFNYIREFQTNPQLDTMIRQRLSPDYPSTSEMERTVSLWFANSYVIDDYPRPYPPNVVLVGGLHIKDSVSPLGPDLQKFLEDVDTKNGFIYVSFGSWIELNETSELTNTLINSMNSLAKSGLHILWKCNLSGVKGVHKNILMSKWLPQQSILAHPKIRGFVAHGGMLGIQETIYYGVPVVAFPILGEQDYHAQYLQWKKAGFFLEITNFTEKQLVEAVKEIVNNPIYTKSIKEMSRIYKDRPTSAIDTAVWWTEYVLRHDDMSFLRPLSVYQSWWKKRQLDVWFAVFSVCVLSIVVFIALVHFICTKVMGNGNVVNKVKKS